MLIAPKWLKLRTSNSTHVFPGTVRIWHLKFFPNRGVFKNLLGGDMHSHERLLVSCWIDSPTGILSAAFLVEGCMGQTFVPIPNCTGVAHNHPHPDLFPLSPPSPTSYSRPHPFQDKITQTFPIEQHYVSLVLLFQNCNIKAISKQLTVKCSVKCYWTQCM